MGTEDKEEALEALLGLNKNQQSPSNDGGEGKDSKPVVSVLVQPQNKTRRTIADARLPAAESAKDEASNGQMGKQEGKEEVKKAEDQPVALEGIAKPSDKDVVCGRGGASYNHIGNVTWRKLIDKFRPQYFSAKKNDKPMISRKVVSLIRESGGRFLKLDEKSGLWFEIGQNLAMDKTSQQMREKLSLRKLQIQQAAEQQQEKMKMAAAAASYRGPPNNFFMPPGGGPGYPPHAAAHFGGFGPGGGPPPPFYGMQHPHPGVGGRGPHGPANGPFMGGGPPGFFGGGGPPPRGGPPPFPPGNHPPWMAQNNFHGNRPMMPAAGGSSPPSAADKSNNDGSDSSSPKHSQGQHHGGPQPSMQQFTSPTIQHLRQHGTMGHGMQQHPPQFPPQMMPNGGPSPPRQQGNTGASPGGSPAAARNVSMV